MHFLLRTAYGRVPTGWRSTRTRRIEWSTTSRMVNSIPSWRNESPGSGRRPRAWKAKPPTVEKSPSVGRWRPEPLVQELEVERGVDLVARAAERDDGVVGGRDVVLVVDRPDEFFEQVFEGDQARDAAVLVEHDGDLRPLRAGTPRAGRRRSCSRGRTYAGRTRSRGMTASGPSGSVIRGKRSLA